MMALKRSAPGWLRLKFVWQPKDQLEEIQAGLFVFRSLWARFYFKPDFMS
jgi:hypothetical protein